MINERKPRLSAQRLVSIALPSVLRERSKSTQQRTQGSNSGLRREISLELVARLAPLMRSRLPRPDANSSIASVIREAPPVNATMPSASRLSETSSAGTCRTNQTKPSPIDSTAAAQSASADQPRRRSKADGPDRSVDRAIPFSVSNSTVGISSPRGQDSAKSGWHKAARNRLMNRFDGAADHVARGCSGDAGDDPGLRQHCQIARHSDRRTTE